MKISQQLDQVGFQSGQVMYLNPRGFANTGSYLPIPRERILLAEEIVRRAGGASCLVNPANIDRVEIDKLAQSLDDWASRKQEEPSLLDQWYDFYEFE